MGKNHNLSKSSSVLSFLIIRISRGTHLLHADLVLEGQRQQTCHIPTKTLNNWLQNTIRKMVPRLETSEVQSFVSLPTLIDSFSILKGFEVLKAFVAAKSANTHYRVQRSCRARHWNFLGCVLFFVCTN